MQNSNQPNQDLKQTENQDKGDQQNDMKRTGQDQRMGKMDPSKEGGDVDEGSEREDLHPGGNVGEKSGSQNNSGTQPGMSKGNTGSLPGMSNKQGTGDEQQDKNSQANPNKAMGNAANRQPNQGNTNDRDNMKQDQDSDNE